MVYLFSFVFFLLFLFLVLFFLSIRILVNTTRQDSYNSHFLELGLFFNTFRFRFVYREKQKIIQFLMGNRKVFSKSLVKEKPIKEKEKKIKSKTKKTFRQKIKSNLKYKTLRLLEMKNHLAALLRSLKNPQIEGQIQIGFSNPMHTGLLLGSYSMLSGIWSDLQNRVAFEPVFTNRTANWRLSFSTRFIIAGLAWRGLLLWKTFRKIK